MPTTSSSICLRLGNAKRSQTVFRHIQGVGFLLNLGNVFTGVEDIDGRFPLTPLRIARATFDHLRFERLPLTAVLRHILEHGDSSTVYWSRRKATLLIRNELKHKRYWHRVGDTRQTGDLPELFDPVRQ